MKTQANRKLQFNKKNIVELNDSTLNSVHGGTDTTSVAIQSHLSPINTSWLCDQNHAILAQSN
ncbi:class I lanthipeptide [Lacinutrix sp. Hel_I_90]|uniref:class I lanthipeptide n=1 Tax=Lacinutrix sp. Hel_I_90 TaxID=1249999 RepID=UPI0005CAF220|nr:class I lanthipeptide [Lacinutrix sp. Hel_I_90]